MIRTCIVSSAILALGLAPVALEQVKLEFKHTEGQASKIETTSKIHQILTIAGMDVETAAENKVTASSKVGKRGSDGRLPIAQKIEALSIQLSLPMGVNITFDSANPNTQNDNPMIQAVLESIKARVGSSHTIVLDKDNKVVAVEGAESILQNASPAAVEILKAEINPEQMKKAAQQNYSVLPSEPVGEGDSWTRTLVTPIGGGQTMTFETKFEYLGTVEKDGKKLDKISMTPMTVVYAMENPNSPLKVTQSTLKIESAKGTMLFDRVRGRPVESNSVTRIVGEMTLSVNGMDLPSKLDLTMESNSEVQ